MAAVALRDWSALFQGEIERKKGMKQRNRHVHFQRALPFTLGEGHDMIKYAFPTICGEPPGS
jgi:hypothetical protein